MEFWLYLLEKYFPEYIDTIAKFNELAFGLIDIEPVYL